MTSYRARLILEGAVEPSIADELEWPAARAEMEKLGYNDVVDSIDRYVAVKLLESSKGISREELRSTVSAARHGNWSSKTILEHLEELLAT